MKNLILALFFVVAGVFAREAIPGDAAKADFEANTYKIDMFSVDSRGGPVRNWDHCHAWACEEAPGYLVSAAHPYFGKTKDGKIMTFDIYNTEYEAKSRGGEKLIVRVSYADLNTDVCLLQIMKGTHPKGLRLALDIDEHSPAFICEEEIGKAKQSKELQTPVKITVDTWISTIRWPHYAVEFKSYNGLSGAPVRQNDGVVFMVQKGNGKYGWY